MQKEQYSPYHGINEGRLGQELPFQFLEELDPKTNNLTDQYSTTNNPVAIYRDGSISMFFRVECPKTAYMSNETITSLRNSLAAFLESVPNNYKQHWFWTTTDQEEEILTEFLNQNKVTGQHPLQHKLRKTQYERESKRLRDGELKGYRAYVAISLPYNKKIKKGKKEVNVANILTTIPALIQDSITSLTQNLIDMTYLSGKQIDFQPEKDAILKNMEKLQTTVELAKASLNNIKAITVHEVTSPEIISYLRKSWSPSAWENAKTNGERLDRMPIRPLNTGFANHYALEQIEDFGDTWKTGDYWHTVLTMHKPPEISEVGVMIDRTACGECSSIYNIEYCLTMTPIDAKKQYAILDHRRRILEKQYASGDFPQNAKILQSIALQMDKLQENDGSASYACSITIHLWNKDKKELEKWKQTISTSLIERPISARMSSEAFHAFPFYVNKCQPGFANDLENSRDFDLLCDEAATFLPLLGCSSSNIQVSPKNRRITMMLETEDGELHPQDCFARGRVNSFGGVGIGSSGSGKSYFYNKYIASTVSDDDEVIVIDGAVAEGSYNMVCNMLMGSKNYIKSSVSVGEKAHCINVLGTSFDENGIQLDPSDQELSRICKNIEPMVREKPTQSLSSSEVAILNKAIRNAFLYRNSTEPVYLRHVSEQLKSMRGQATPAQIELADKFSTMLEDQWCGKGTYAKFFDGPSSELNPKLVVFDCNGVKDNATLRNVLVASYFNYIDQRITTNLNRVGKKKRIHVLIDEAWSALQDPTMVQMVIGLYRAGRARNVSPHLITQKMSDLQKLLQISDAGSGTTEIDKENDAILSNCTWFNLFKHEPSDAMITQKLLGLTDTQTEVLKSLGGSDGKYKEMIQATKLSKGMSFTKLKYRPVGLEFPMFTSDASDISKLKEIYKYWVTKLNMENRATRREGREKAIKILENKGYLGLMHLTEDQLLRTLTCHDFVEQLKNK